MRLGKKLRDIRKTKGLSLEEVAADLELSKGYLSKVERGIIKDVSVSKAENFADYYNVALTELLERDDNWKEKLPERLRKFVDEQNIGYLEIGLKAKDKGLSPEEVDNLIDIISNHLANKES
jgi:transcriptional regulator with XRE-family HTH domain